MPRKLTRIKSPHWYKTFIEECPVCGRRSIYKERVYGNKPKDTKECYKFISTYDYCDG